MRLPMDAAFFTACRARLSQPIQSGVRLWRFRHPLSEQGRGSCALNARLAGRGTYIGTLVLGCGAHCRSGKQVFQCVQAQADQAADNGAVVADELQVATDAQLELSD